MSSWHLYTELVVEHSVVGALRVQSDVYSPQLDNKRDVLVWLPPSYHESDTHYPVIYMHDGQNLFDRHTSYSGEWQVDETMTDLATAGYEAIIVGLPNMGDDRRAEYNPYAHPRRRVGAKGSEYMHWIIDTVKPMIDADFRTLVDPANTGIAGSSMGGLISLYGFLVHQDIFGFCGAFSAAYWFGAGALLNTVSDYATGNGKIYLDIGTQEGPTLNYSGKAWDAPTKDQDNAYVRGIRQLRDALLKYGYHEGDNLMYVEDEGAGHNEPAWARRFPEAVRFLLGCETVR